MSIYLHADYTVLRDQLVENEYVLSHHTDTTEWWHPRGYPILEIGVELPTTDPYYSVAVHFDYHVTTQELELLRFPL